jgi:hypothetical protein
MNQIIVFEIRGIFSNSAASAAESAKYYSQPVKNSCE